MRDKLTSADFLKFRKWPTSDAFMVVTKPARACSSPRGGRCRQPGPGGASDALARHPGRSRAPVPARHDRQRHALPVAPDLMGQAFQVAEPNRVWLADITYLPTAEGWLYLAAVLDLAKPAHDCCVGSVCRAAPTPCCGWYAPSPAGVRAAQRAGRG